MTSIVQLIEYQKNKKVFHLFCDHCKSQFKETLPITMRLQQIECPECLTAGFCIGQTARRKSDD